VLDQWPFFVRSLPVRSLLLVIPFVRLLFGKRTTLVWPGGWLRHDRLACADLVAGSRRNILIAIPRKVRLAHA
jgi:hypothetical protein